MHQMKSHRDLYELLKLKPGANLSEIRKAYRHAALIAHPDKGGNAQAFHVVKLAFEVLSSVTTQAPYHTTRAGQTNCPRVPRRYKANCSGLAKSATARKRPSLCSPSGAKRHCSSPLKQTYHNSSLSRSLEHMRRVLQSMTVPQRLLSIQSVEPEARAEMLSFMMRVTKSTRMETKTDRQRQQSYDRSKACALASVRSNIRRIDSSLGTKYKAHLVIKGLRLYADATSYEAAIDNHIVFVQMRDAVFAASRDNPTLWEHPTSLLEIFRHVLNDNSTSEESIGLHVFIYMRATPWLDKKTFITSPVMKLYDAVHLYIRLLRAQMASWENLRYEWVTLLQRKRNIRKEALPLREAEAIVDHARANALGQQFKRAMQALHRAVKRKTAKRKAEHKHAARLERKSKMMKIRTAALERKAINQRLRACQLRRQGLNGKELTMEHFLNGRG
jgi:curved DNA-binding protein CbpA